MRGEKLKKKLLELKVNQKQLAGLLNVTPQSVNSILTATDVRSGTIEKIAKVLDVPILYFYGEEGGNVAVASGNVSGASNSGDVTINASGEIPIMKERIAHLESLVSEKERLIQVLLGKYPSPIE